MILSLDFGTKKVGIAISDEDEKYALPLKTIFFSKSEKENKHIIFEKIYKEIECYSPRIVILGFPSITRKKHKVLYLIKKLKRFLELKNLNVVLWNESMTTQQAKLNIGTKNKRKIDSESARIIAQEYLDYLNSKNII